MTAAFRTRRTGDAKSPAPFGHGKQRRVPGRADVPRGTLLSLTIDALASVRLDRKALKRRATSGQEPPAARHCKVLDLDANSHLLGPRRGHREQANPVPAQRQSSVVTKIITR